MRRGLGDPFTDTGFTNRFDHLLDGACRGDVPEKHLKQSIPVFDTEFSSARKEA
jgi:hypothetical protein